MKPIKLRTLMFFLLALICSTSFAQKTKVNFDHYALLVKDLDTSSDFYMNILGLAEIEDKTEQPHIRWFSMGGKTELHVIEDKQYSVTDVKGVHLALKAEDLDVLIEHLHQHKITFYNWFGEVDTTNTRPDGVRQVYFRDPNGYWIEVNGD
ncbi:MAG: VOC family protein [Bacteroidetes bacterium]|nr:VOC family protein [Bacteroidota bacterium]